MDDFYAEMKPFLDDSSSSAQQISDRQERALRMGSGGASAPSYGVVESYAPGLFADALLPVNARHLPAYYAGTIAGPSDPDTSLLDRLTLPYDNMVAAQEYLATSQSDVQYRDRLYQFAQDTTLLSILGFPIGVEAQNPEPFNSSDEIVQVNKENQQNDEQSLEKNTYQNSK